MAGDINPDLLKSMMQWKMQHALAEADELHEVALVGRDKAYSEALARVRLEIENRVLRETLPLPVQTLTVATENVLGAAFPPSIPLCCTEYSRHH